LNDVVEDSSAGLKLLTRTAAGLQIRPSITHSTNSGSTAPVCRHSDEANSVPSGSSSLDPGVFAPSQSDPFVAANALLSILFPTVFKSIEDVGAIPTTRLGTTSERSHSSVPDLPSTKPAVSHEWNHGMTNNEFTPALFSLQMPLFTSDPAVPADGSADRFPFSSTALPLPRGTNRVSGRPLPEQPAIAVSLAYEGSPPHSRHRRSVGPQMDHPHASHTASHEVTAWTHPPSVDPTFPSATPPPALSPSSVSQGDVYVDGSRLGRWMTTHLAKAAELPRAATTGFDPRMTPTWPGAPVSA
jgi:hypothetical protein